MITGHFLTAAFCAMLVFVLYITFFGDDMWKDGRH